MRHAISADTSSRSRWDIGLERISKLILAERRNLIPHIHSLPKHDSDRSDKLWRKYTRSGIFMSNGGVGRSFLSGADVRSGSEMIRKNLDEYNLYRSDRPESTLLAQERIKQFLADDGLISAASDREKIAVEFSLGSHEAFTRLLRCIRDDKKTQDYFILLAVTDCWCARLQRLKLENTTSVWCKLIASVVKKFC